MSAREAPRRMGVASFAENAEGVGVLAPGEMFDAPGFLRALAPEYLTFESKDTEVMSQKC
jgi:hypothetical protein